MSKNTRQVAKSIKLAVLIRDNFECVYCGANLRNAERRDATVDHIICKSKGGTNRPTNLVTACDKCNTSRGEIDLKRWANGSTMKKVEKQRMIPVGKYLKLSKQILKREVIE